MTMYSQYVILIVMYCLVLIIKFKIPYDFFKHIIMLYFRSFPVFDIQKIWTKMIKYNTSNWWKICHHKLKSLTSYWLKGYYQAKETQRPSFPCMFIIQYVGWLLSLPLKIPLQLWKTDMVNMKLCGLKQTISPTYSSTLSNIYVFNQPNTMAYHYKWSSFTK